MCRQRGEQFFQTNIEIARTKMSGNARGLLA
jgi:hypothetical protein